VTVPTLLGLVAGLFLAIAICALMLGFARTKKDE
jgi:hypothetical protein